MLHGSGLIFDLVADFLKTYEIRLVVLCVIDINICKFDFFYMAYINRFLKHEPRPKKIIRFTQ